MSEVHEALARAHREEWARVVAGLARRVGDLDVAEEAAAEAFATAAERWPRDGVPANPGGWLTTTARRKAVDRLRREGRRTEKHQEALLLHAGPPEPLGAVEDDRLRLLLTCCHPALAMPARVALTLRLVAGLDVARIARAFLVRETTIAQRITRAKAKIAAARVPYRVPEAEDLPARVDGVLAVLYVVLTEGHAGTDAAAAPVRDDLCEEVVRLARLLHELLPHDGEVAGLLALALLVEARRPARLGPDGALVPLDEQDRTRWDADLVADGHRLVRARLASGEPPGRYQVLAAIHAVHTSAPTFAATDWRQVVALYDQLSRLDPSPVVALNRAVALAELDGPAVGLAAVEPLADALDGYGPFHATCSVLLRRLGRTADADAAHARAVALADHPAQVTALERRRARSR